MNPMVEGGKWYKLTNDRVTLSTATYSYSYSHCYFLFGLASLFDSVLLGWIKDETETTLRPLILLSNLNFLFYT